MIDFHSHILPGIDDGSRSVAESLELLRAEAAQGVAHVVATPHFYPRYDAPERFLERREKSEGALRRALERYPELPGFTVGAEVHFFRGMSDSDLLPRLTFGKKQCILIEMPQAPWSESMYRELAQVREKWGLQPIVAHVDRYIRPFHTYGIPQRLEELPVLVQANASFFTDRATASLALRLLRAGQIQLLGSDCHDPVERAPDLGTAADRIRRKLGSGPLDRMEELGRYLL